MLFSLIFTPLLLLSLTRCKKNSQSSQSGQSIVAYGADMLNYVDFNVSYRIDEKYKLDSVYVVAEVKAKAGYRITKIITYIECGISYSATDMYGEDKSGFKTKDIYIYSTDKKFEEHVVSETDVTYVRAYFQRTVSKSGGSQCNLEKL